MKATNRLVVGVSASVIHEGSGIYPTSFSFERPKGARGAKDLPLAKQLAIARVSKECKVPAKDLCVAEISVTRYPLVLVLRR